MEELKALIVDAATGESYERPLTAEELADREVMQAEAVRLLVLLYLAL